MRSSSKVLEPPIDPQLQFTMSAPLSTAYRIPWKPNAMDWSLVGELVLIGMKREFQLTPAIPVALLATAQAMPAVWVPCEAFTGVTGSPVGSLVPLAKFQPCTSST